MKRMNSSGIAHFMLLAVLVLGLGVFGVYKSVSNTAQVSTSSTCSTKVLRQGSSGACVEQLQNKLGVEVDGKFGPQTHAAVKAYQSKNGLKVDGIVGKATWGKLQVGSREVYCTYRMKADNTEVVAQGMQYSKCVSLGGKPSSRPNPSTIKAQATAKPKPVKPAPNTKPSPRASDGRQVYCTYKDGDNTLVNKQPMTLAQCTALKGRSSTTPPKISCTYTTKSGNKTSKLLGNAKACEVFRQANNYGVCDLQTGPDRKETKNQCSKHKSTSPTGSGTWREF